MAVVGKTGCGLSTGTIKNYTSSIYSKLGVDSRRQAVLLIAAMKFRGNAG